MTEIIATKIIIFMILLIIFECIFSNIIEYFVDKHVNK